MTDAWHPAHGRTLKKTGRPGLSPSTNLRTSSASLRAAGPVLSKAEGVGEPRRGPEELAPAEAGGHATANMVLATFAETKVARLPGRNPASPNITGILLLGN